MAQNQTGCIQNSYPFMAYQMVAAYDTANMFKVQEIGQIIIQNSAMVHAI